MACFKFLYLLMSMLNLYSIFLGIYKHRPTDKDAKLKFTECKKIVQQMAFQVYIIIIFINSSVSDPYHFDSVNRIFPIKCYARL